MKQEEKNLLYKCQRINSWACQKFYYCVGKSHQRNWTVKRGEVYFVDLGENIGSEENKLRPIVVLQANAYNFKSPVFTCAIISNSPVTLPDIQIPIINSYPYTDEKGISKVLSGAIDLGQIKTIAKERIISKKVCLLSNEMNDVDCKLLNIFGIKSMLSKRDNIIESLNGKIEYLKKNG